MNKKRKVTPSNNSNLSPIPKLTCLVQNFNIPKPIIHPPGSDPYQFLNTTPHCSSKLNPMDPMILDPCVVAARFDVVPKTTHLTASEHAGIFLGETTTTIMSTEISESSGQPEDNIVVVPTTKSDAMVTNIEFDNTPTPTLPNFDEFMVEKDNVVKKTESVVFMKEIESNVEETKPEILVVATKTESVEIDGDVEETKPENLVVATKTVSVVEMKEIESDVEERKPENVVVATKSESKNGKFIICDVCKVTCNSEQVYKRHKEGKIHLKNMLKLPVSSVIKQEANNTCEKECEKKNDLLENGVSMDSLFYCNVPPLGADDNHQTIQNVATEQVITPLRMDQLRLNPSLMSTNAGDLSNGGTQKEEDDNNKLINLKDSETIVVPPSITPIISMQVTPRDNLKSNESNIGGVLWCEVCKVNYVSDRFNTHLLGKKHLKKLNKPNDACSLQCELCGVCCSTCDALNKHKLGKKHLKNLKKLEQQIIPTVSDEVSKVVDSDNGKRKANESLVIEEDEDAKKQKMMEKEVGFDAALIPCKVCNVVCTGFMAFKSHLSSKEHATMALKQVNAA